MKQPTNAVIVERLDQLIELVKKHVQEDREQFQELDDAINGNGHEGFKVRIDRLEQHERQVRWQTRTFWVLVGTGIVAFIRSHLG